MKLFRPYIPYDVRVTVAARQAIAAGVYPRECEIGCWPYTRQLRELLYVLFGDERVHLDHDPPLMLRSVQRNKNGEIIKYLPDANDPEFLIYRTAEDHDIKTRVRGDGAQHSDLGLRRKNKNIAANRNNKPKQKIAQRKNFKWPKRKMRSTVKG